jgi:hypothetical protein
MQKSLWFDMNGSRICEGDLLTDTAGDLYGLVKLVAGAEGNFTVVDRKGKCVSLSKFMEKGEEDVCIVGRHMSSFSERPKNDLQVS